MGKTIGVLSLKGGVGKTSSVIALGSAIADFNKKVLLVDANFSAPNLGLHLKIIDPPATIHDVLKRTANINDSIYTYKNFDVMPASIFFQSSINPLKLKDKLKSVKRKYDIVLIDSSPALNEETLATMIASDEILVVTTPDIPTLSTTLKAVKLAKQKKIPINGLILNKVHNKNFELSMENIEKTAGVPVLAVIPYNIDILKSLSKFMPSTYYKPRSKDSTEFKKLAAVLIGEKYQPSKFKAFFKITPKRQEINREIFYERVFG